MTGSRASKALLFQLAPRDPVTFGGAAAVLVAGFPGLRPGNRGATVSLPVPRPLLLRSEDRLRLAINEVVHCDNVMLRIVIRSKSNVSRGNSHAGNPRVVERYAQERLASIAWRRWHGTTEKQPAVSTKKLHQRAGSAV